MKSPFGGGYSMATIVYPEAERIRVLCAAVPYEYEIDMSKSYEWEFASIRENGVNRFASVAELAQIARFFDSARDYGTTQNKGAMASLKAYIYFAALVNKYASYVDMVKAA